MELEVTFTLHVQSASAGGYIAYFPALRGWHAQACTIEEVIGKAKDVLACHLEKLIEDGEETPVEMRPAGVVEFDMPLTVSLES